MHQTFIMKKINLLSIAVIIFFAIVVLDACNDRNPKNIQA